MVSTESDEMITSNSLSQKTSIISTLYFDLKLGGWEKGSGSMHVSMRARGREICVWVRVVMF